MASANGTNGNGTNGHAPAVTNGAEVTKPLPPTWDAAKVDQVLEIVASGESVRNACITAQLSRDSLNLWVRNDIAGLAHRYARAREAQVQAMEDELLAIADDSRRDTITRRAADGSEYEVPDNEWIARSKLRVDTRKWIMAKVHPKQYGDTPPPVAVNVTNVQFVIDPFQDHRDLSAEAIEAAPN